MITWELENKMRVYHFRVLASMQNTRLFKEANKHNYKKFIWKWVSKVWLQVQCKLLTLKINTKHKYKDLIYKLKD